MRDSAVVAANAGAAGWSLERRLRRRLLVALVILWLLGGALALAGMRHETAEILDSGLAEVAQRLLVLPREALGGAATGTRAPRTTKPFARPKWASMRSG